jgi:hypothetical protein
MTPDGNVVLRSNVAVLPTIIVGTTGTHSHRTVTVESQLKSRRGGRPVQTGGSDRNRQAPESKCELPSGAASSFRAFRSKSCTMAATRRNLRHTLTIQPAISGQFRSPW